MFPCFPMCQQCETEVFFGYSVEELKILRLFTTLTLKRNQRSPIAATLDVDHVRRRINISYRLSTFNFNAPGNGTDLS